MPEPIDLGGIAHPVLLPDGRALIIGGFSDFRTGVPPANGVVYDPLKNSWAKTAPMPVPLDFFAATPLRDGRILVAGGATDAFGRGVPVAEAEIYDSAADVWAPAAPMHEARDWEVAVPLPSGDVLVAGGARYYGPATADAEIYQPGRDRWISVAPMEFARYGHSAVLLPDGRVLIVGGTDQDSGSPVAPPFSEVFTEGDDLIDRAPPTITCDPPQAGWQPDDAVVPCAAADDGSGLASPADATFSLSTAVPDGGRGRSRPDRIAPDL